LNPYKPVPNVFTLKKRGRDEGIYDEDDDDVDIDGKGTLVARHRRRDK